LFLLLSIALGAAGTAVSLHPHQGQYGGADWTRLWTDQQRAFSRHPGAAEQSEGALRTVWGHVEGFGRNVQGTVMGERELGSDERHGGVWQSATEDLRSARSLRAASIPSNVISSLLKMCYNAGPAVVAALSTTCGSFFIDHLLQLSARKRKRVWINFLAFMSAFHGAQCSSKEKAINRSYLIGATTFVMAFFCRVISNAGSPARNPHTGKKKPGVFRLFQWAIYDAFVVGSSCRLASNLARTPEHAP
jgi:hypothetical protein